VKDVKTDMKTALAGSTALGGERIAMKQKNPSKSKDKVKKRRILAIALIALIALIIIFGLNMKVTTSTAEQSAFSIMPAPTPDNRTVSMSVADPVAILSIRGCTINTDTHLATIDTKLENLRNSAESFKLYFEFSNNGKTDKTFLLGPKEKRVTDIPFSGAEGIATAYLYHYETGSSTVLIQKKSINLTCSRIGGSGGSEKVDPPLPIPPTPELSSIILVSVGLFGIIVVSRKYKGN
jgi:hypothetical protein